ncbi:hypothetical protein SAMN05428963_11390 [Consotaella salsifontis]|uniref:Uncharacterized protein n=1 Tax=Consotaella salsifontis TaxID=1365950 RepID=A0A1T4SS24_9HYPH|nr:hypothetical protein SAMN05428963_11390 [Consotaella salsifontis]
MKTYAKFDDGHPDGFWREDLFPVRPDGARHPDIPADAVEITEAQWRDFVDHPGRRIWQDGAVVAYDPPPPPLTESDYSRAVQAHLDAKARERRYDSIQAAVTYRGDPNAQFAAEAEALIAWRSAVWTYATAQLAAVEAGEREQPTVEAFLAELPVFEWPD